MRPYLKPIGLEIEVAPHSLASGDLYSGTGHLLLPAVIETGRLPTYCSGYWKRDVVERWLQSRGVEETDQWLGFSWDERNRVGQDHRPWCHLKYPLIDRLITRSGCLMLVQKAGLPEPPKSRCWMCPHQNAEEWREIRDDPEEWAAAIALDDAIYDLDERGGVRLHSSGVRLADADLGQHGDEIPPLFRHCQGVGCWT